MYGNKLSLEEINDLEEKIADVYDDFTSILCHINTKGEVETFLKLIDHEDLLKDVNDSTKTHVKGTVMILGSSNVKPNDIIKIICDLGVSKERIITHLGKKLGGYNVQNLRHDHNTSLILIGSVAHSLRGKGHYQSVIEMMEKEEGYPPVMRLATNGKLKITKTNLKKSIKKAILEGTLVLQQSA